MALKRIPRELQSVARELLAEFQLACGIDRGEADWLVDYEILQLRAPKYTRGRALEAYLPRPLVEDLANLTLAERKDALESLRGLPARAAAGEGDHWLLGEEGEVQPLEQRPFV